MEPLIQVILDLIMDGSLGGVKDRNIPMAGRVIAAIILIAAFGSLIGFCVFLMMKGKNLAGKACGALLLLLTLHAIHRFFKTYKQKKG